MTESAPQAFCSLRWLGSAWSHPESHKCACRPCTICWRYRLQRLICTAPLLAIACHRSPNFASCLGTNLPAPPFTHVQSSAEARPPARHSMCPDGAPAAMQGPNRNQCNSVEFPTQPLLPSLARSAPAAWRWVQRPCNRWHAMGPLFWDG